MQEIDIFNPHLFRLGVKMTKSEKQCGKMYGQNHSFDYSCRHDVILGQASFNYNIKLAFSTSQHCPETPREMECYVAT